MLNEPFTQRARETPPPLPITHKLSLTELSLRHCAQSGLDRLDATSLDVACAVSGRRSDLG
eukprot:4771265-Prymnesium_polylepis.1